MGILSKKVLNCGINIQNTGAAPCFFHPKNIEGVILIPKGKTFTDAEIQDFKTTLQDLCKADNIADRIFPIKRFEGLEDKSTDTKYEDTPYGGKRKASDGRYAWYFTITDGGMAMFKALKSFDQKQGSFDPLFIDRVNNVIWGATNADDLYGGFDLELIDVPNFKINDGSKSTTYQIGFCMEDTTQVNLNNAVVKFPDDVNILKELNGLKNLEVSIHTAMTSGGLIKLKLTTGDGAVDLYEILSTELATSSLYTATNKATGAAITVTSVTAAAATKTFNVQLNAADSDYPAPAGAMIDFAIGEVSDLETADVVGYGNTSFSAARG